jgi:hypothetical protein
MPSTGVYARVGTTGEGNAAKHYDCERIVPTAGKPDQAAEGEIHLVEVQWQV